MVRRLVQPLRHSGPARAAGRLDLRPGPVRRPGQAAGREELLQRVLPDHPARRPIRRLLRRRMADGPALQVIDKPLAFIHSFMLYSPHMHMYNGT